MWRPSQQFDRNGQLTFYLLGKAVAKFDLYYVQVHFSCGFIKELEQLWLQLCMLDTLEDH